MTTPIAIPQDAEKIRQINGHTAPPVWDRLISRRNITPKGCWEYTGAKANGYGRLSVNGRNESPHRVSYEIHFGRIPDGMLVCHHCDNPPCFNPEHLFLGDYSDNFRDCLRKGRRKHVRSVRLCGIKNPHAKIRDEDVIRIRSRYSTGDRLYQIAQDYGMCSSTICQIVQGLRWKHIPGAVPLRNESNGMPGEHNAQAKLTPDKVRSIISDTRTRRAIAACYGVSKSTVDRIKDGKGWRNVQRIACIPVAVPEGRKG